MKKAIIALTLICFVCCKPNTHSADTSIYNILKQSDIPLVIMEDLVPKDKIVHKGIFNPEMNEYYYTLSDTGFQQFDVYVVREEFGSWSSPERAFFNSSYNEHGMSFSPDGKSVYFSSTRPTNRSGEEDTWQIWKSDRKDGEWSKPKFIDIPNLRDKLVSHPIMTNSGTLYFHSANVDYGEMDLYYAENKDGKFQDAVKVSIPTNSQHIQKCTPYVSPKEEYLLFARVGNHLDLMITFNNGQGKWTAPKRLSGIINKNSKGNSFVTVDGKYLLYTTGIGKDWKVRWMNFDPLALRE